MLRKEPSMTSKPYYQRALLPFLSIMVATMACFCTATPYEACVNTYDSSDPEIIAECTEYVTGICGEYRGSESDPQAVTAHKNCVYAAASQLQYQALSSGGGACASFRLTSPLDGLNNGVNTFYWDPYQGATGYRIQIYESGALRASFDVNSSQTNLTADVSTGAIGQGSMFLIRAQAFVGPSVACSNDTMIIRGAPAGGFPTGGNNIVAPPITIPPTPDLCGNNYCGDPGENIVTCYQDCQPK